MGRKISDAPPDTVLDGTERLAASSTTSITTAKIRDYSAAKALTDLAAVSAHGSVLGTDEVFSLKGGTLGKSTVSAIVALATGGGGGGGGGSTFLSYPYTYDPLATAKSLAYLPASYTDADDNVVPYAVGDTFTVGAYDSAFEAGSSNIWRIVGNANLGPVGHIGYRTLFGATLPGSVSILSTLASVGFVAGNTITINSQTITVMASGASGNNQINVGDVFQNMLLKFSALLLSNLGDGARFDFLTLAGNPRIVVESADDNALFSTASIAVSGTSGSLIGFPTGTYPFATGFTMEGTNWRFQSVPGPGGIVDMRAYGQKCDGVTVADYRVMRRLARGCAALGYKLVNNYGSQGNIPGARLRIDRTLNLTRCSCDVRIQAGSPSDVTGGSGDGDYFDQAAHIQYVIDLAAWVGGGSIPGVEPPNPNIGVEVFDYEYYDGTVTSTRYVGIGAIGAGDASNSFSCRQMIDVRGDGSFDFGVRATVVGATFLDDNAAMGDYEARGAYCDIACVFGGNLEKQRPRVKAVYCNFVGFAWFSLSPTNKTPDTLRVDLNGNDCKHVVWEINNTDQSIIYNLMFEGHQDAGDTSPAIRLRGGKHGAVEGRVRGANGGGQMGAFIEVDKSTNLGTDTTRIDVEFVHSQGLLLDYIRGRYLYGHMQVKDCTNSLTTGQPIIWLRRIVDAGGFKFSGVSIYDTGTSGGLVARTAPVVRIGDTGTTYHADGLYAIDCNYGQYSIHAGLTAPLWDGAGSGHVVGDVRDDGKEFPTASAALMVDFVKAVGGSISIIGGQGHVNIGAAVSASSVGKTVVFLCRTHRRYTNTGTLANADFVYLDQQMNAWTSKVSLPAATTGYASLSVPPGTAPTSPANGDIWFVGDDMFRRIGGFTKKVTFAP